MHNFNITSKLSFTFALLFTLFSHTKCQNNNVTSQKKEQSSNTSALKFQNPKTAMNYNPLNSEEQRVIINKGTEMPFVGELTDKFDKGTYICKQCNAALYKSDSKFHSGCGWPSFDDEIKGAVTKIPDADGRRTEIVCTNCKGHLGHVFYGEGLTDKDTRHCVNSISMKFVSEKAETKTQIQKAIFAGGCFWGVEYYFQNAKGVTKTQVGYIGGHKDNPTYREVCDHTTGHIEAMEVSFDPSQTTFEELAKLFFEIHDPTQANGQGPDIGEQYLSVVFYLDQAQKTTTEKLISTLKTKGYNVVTQLRKATKFWAAEDYHQQYYEHKGSEPYCHKKTSRF